MRRYHYTASQFTKTQLVWCNHECLWVSVPKNANMMMRKFCESTGMLGKNVTLKTIPNCRETVTIVRDPRTRILSGLSEFQKRKAPAKIKKFTVTELLKQLLNDISIFDEHLEPQAFYLQNFTFTHILKFEDLNNELKTVNHFHNYSRLIDESVRPELLTSSRKLGDLSDIVTENESLLTQCIEKYYTMDLDIWNNSANYTNTQIKYKP